MKLKIYNAYNSVNRYSNTCNNYINQKLNIYKVKYHICKSNS